MSELMLSKRNLGISMVVEIYLYNGTIYNLLFNLIWLKKWLIQNENSYSMLWKLSISIEMYEIPRKTIHVK